MKKLSIFLITLFFSVTLSAQESLKGTWSTGEENTKIQTYQKDGKWYGKIISSDNPKAEIGFDVLREFKKEKGEWSGKIFAAKKGKLMDAKIKPEEDLLEISVSAGFFSKTLKWKKVKE